jgi:uncharacterized protein YqgC (DUF456 family)
MRLRYIFDETKDPLYELQNSSLIFSPRFRSAHFEKSISKRNWRKQFGFSLGIVIGELVGLIYKAVVEFS